MTDELSSHDYWEEIHSIVETIRDECADEGVAPMGDEDKLWEAIDSHQWVIYTAYNFDVLRHSENDGYYVDNFGSDGLVKDGVLSTDLLAYGAMYGDCLDYGWRLDGFDWDEVPEKQEATPDV